jgi:hypothetical protein
MSLPLSRCSRDLKLHSTYTDNQIIHIRAATSTNILCLLDSYQAYIYVLIKGPRLCKIKPVDIYLDHFSNIFSMLIIYKKQMFHYQHSNNVLFSSAQLAFFLPQIISKAPNEKGKS